MSAGASVEISIVVPCHNERDNLPRLVEAIGRVLDPTGKTYEVLITDDCSTDDSWDVIRNLSRTNPKVRGQRLNKNSGESAASWAGLRAARGAILVTMDADLQNDPADLPGLLVPVGQFDCVCGTRVANRGKGDSFIKVISSRIANGIRNWLSGEQISDAGCTYRAFRRECVAPLKFFHGMHRFFPTLFKIEGFTVTEVAVTNNPRFAGQSHYGVWNRLFKSFYDLLAVRWMKKRMFLYHVAETTES
jgi:glycosyltransferase involved in cell wall biosynthesis